MLELTVFIRVKIANLKALSKFMPDIVNNEDNIHSENIKIKTEIKYLFMSTISSLEPENSSLFTNIFNGFAWDASSFIENLKS